MTTEVPFLKCSISKLGAFSLGEAGKYFFHNLRSKEEDTEHSQKLKSLEGHTAVSLCKCHLN